MRIGRATVTNAFDPRKAVTVEVEVRRVETLMFKTLFDAGTYECSIQDIDGSMAKEPRKVWESICLSGTIYHIKRLGIPGVKIGFRKISGRIKVWSEDRSAVALAAGFALLRAFGFEPPEPSVEGWILQPPVGDPSSARDE